MPNPWDAGTAKLLADFGFEAIATSSAALAWTLAKPDATGAVTRDDAIAHAQLLAEASGLPVNGDFESGYGDTPAEVAETIRRTIDAGVAGCSIEDKDQTGGGLYPLDEALRRFSAAKEAVLKSGSDFVLTGRCEVCSSKHPDPLGEAVRRLQGLRGGGRGCRLCARRDDGGGGPRHRRSGEGAGQRARRPRRHLRTTSPRWRSSASSASRSARGSPRSRSARS